MDDDSKKNFLNKKKYRKRKDTCQFCNKTFEGKNSVYKHEKKCSQNAVCSVCSLHLKNIEELKLQILGLEQKLKDLTELNMALDDKNKSLEQKLSLTHTTLYDKPMCESLDNKILEAVKEHFIDDFYLKHYKNFKQRELNDPMNPTHIKSYMKPFTRETQKKIRILFSMIFKNVGKVLPPIKLTATMNRKKNKYVFNEEELLEALELVRIYASKQKKYKEIMLFFSLVSTYGIRPSQLINTSTLNWNSESNELNIFDQKGSNSRLLAYNILYEHKKFLDELKKNGNNKIFDFEPFNSKKKFFDAIKYLLWSRFNKNNANKLSIGIYCFRKTLFYNNFEGLFNSVLDQVKEISRHTTSKTLSSYIKTKQAQYFHKIGLTALEDIEFIPKKLLNICWKPNSNTLAENFKFSREYVLNKNEAKVICFECLILIEKEDSNTFNCKNCLNFFHKKICASFSNENHCVHCRFYFDKETNLRNIVKEVKNCVNCQELSSVPVCLKCSISKKPKVNSVKKINDVKFICPKSSSSNEFENSLSKLIKVGDLYKKNICNCNAKPCCQNQIYLLDPVKISKQNELIVKKNIEPPLAVGNSQELGYYVYATENILANTFLVEYLGDIFNEYEIDFHNDSQMILIENGLFGFRKVIIPPKNGGNISRYISGFYDESKNNVKAIPLVTSDDINHIYLYASKDIQKDEILYYNYGSNYSMKDFKYYKSRYDLK